ncbi:MAG: orotate phosphoribosyltransferase, partial [Candidatus Aminicenantes bacterium]|nr:orotate phosphoribosyltransferase [Candidatus Aminicenantes bacterium]
ASGKKSNFYVDARITTLHPEGAFLIGKLFLDMLEGIEVNSIGGYSIGADPIVSSISVRSFIEKKPIPAFIIRKQEKTYGTGKIIEGNFKKGDKVIIFDDVVTSGGSILKGAAEVEKAGGSVLGAMAVIDREEGGREMIETAGYPFTSIFTKSDLL